MPNELDIKQASSSSSPPGLAYDATTDVPDVERSSTSPKTATRDPYKFTNGVKSDAELAELRRRKRGKRLASYHHKQNNLIASLLKPMEEHTEDARNEDEALRIPIKIAVHASLIANFSLAVLQIYAAVTSASLSLLATGIDSVFDIGSNVLLYWINVKANRMDHNKWPVGGARLETIGNIVYGFLMGSVNLVVIVESCRDLITHPGGDLNKLHIPSLVAVGAALVVKFLLFLYCYSLRKKSNQVEVLWEDHRNDLFLNSFGLLMSAGGSKLAWWLDPMGAIIIGSGVIIAWGRTIYTQFGLLAGRSAPHEFLQLITYKVTTFSDEIDKIDTVRAYHSGPDYFVEVDVVMDASTPLWKAHDLSQQLQDKIEVLPNVERAFVHVDHETTHTPEHRKYV
ncbi:hypothetical protein BV25DRAFT_1828957 [Artomyces pyxidatus]|uniref:Uncharacterized protein n=1 Tax=Artomyces pyxidatus TaxID=48021 RepID=A0ACB8ST75_9AGAM|nr:hypothetical protein BV25DRAFT_1828957 [Artomyces pyxidatus]